MPLEFFALLSHFASYKGQPRSYSTFHFSKWVSAPTKWMNWRNSLICSIWLERVSWSAHRWIGSIEVFSGSPWCLQTEICIVGFEAIFLLRYLLCHCALSHLVSSSFFEITLCTWPSGSIPASDIGLVVRSLNKCPSEAELKQILKKVRNTRIHFWLDVYNYDSSCSKRMSWCLLQGRLWWVGNF